MFIFRFLIRHLGLLSILLATSVVVALMEGVGISLVFPLLQSLTGSTNTNVPFPFNHVTHFFAGMPVSQTLQIVAVLLFSITLVKATLLYLSILLAARLQVLAIGQSQMECVKQVMKVPIGYFQKRKNADFQLIFSSHTESAVGATINLIGTGLSRLFTTIILLVLLFLLSWKLALASIFLLGISSLAVRKISRKVLDAGRAVNNARHGFNSVLFEIINGMKLIHQFSREGNMVDKYHRRVDNFNKALYEAAKLSQSVAPIFETTGTGILSLILIGGSLVLSHGNTVWIGILFTFVIILNRLSPPVKVLNQTFATFFERVPALRELDLFLSERNKAYLKNGTEIFQGVREKIELRNVEFSYTPGEATILKNVSFNIPRGTKIGIVGPSGSGKSTITELLMRFYDPQKGHIFADQVDLQDMDLQSWRRCIGVVAQDTFLFSDTIRANIAFGKPNATLNEIEQAAQRAHIHEFIQTLPAGYDTFIGERGVLLSGGQRQRLAIARAILTEPEILIFDEATSALDSESEQIVQNAMDEIAQGKTVITIAHRLSTLRDSDMIVVIDNGYVIEKGKHDELLKNHGLYQKLVSMQSLEPGSMSSVAESQESKKG